MFLVPSCLFVCFLFCCLFVFFVSCFGFGQCFPIEDTFKISFLWMIVLDDVVLLALVCSLARGLGKRSKHGGLFHW